MGKHIFYIFSILSIVILVLFGLLNKANLPNTRDNGFNRSWIGDITEIDKNRSVSPLLTRFCGIVDNDYYIATKDPFFVFRFSDKLVPKDTIILDLPPINGPYAPNLFSVSSTSISILFPNSELMLRYSVFNSQLDSVKLLSNIFTRFARISDSIAIVRALSYDQTAQMFKKVDLQTGEVLIEKPIIEKDSSFMGFDSDGMLLADQETGMLLYVQYYCNEVYCFDSSLKLVYRSHTIDTVGTNRTRYTKLKKSGSEKITTSTSRLVVNRDCVIDAEHQLFFVRSNLKSDEQTIDQFNRHHVFDIYKLDDGRYIGSFNIPRSPNRVLSIAIDPPYLLILEKGNLIKYKLDYRKIPSLSDAAFERHP